MVEGGHHLKKAPNPHPRISSGAGGSLLVQHYRWTNGDPPEPEEIPYKS